MGFFKLTLFKKSQKLLDRFLFLFFAEDRFLLPPNSVRLILDDWEDFGNKYIVKWNIRDSNQNLVSGGFYIYQIIIDKKVYQGSIIIAR